MKAANRPYRVAVLGVFLSALVILIFCPYASAQTKVQPVVLKGARLIDGTGRPPIENSVLVIEGKQIVAAGKAGAASESNPRKPGGSGPQKVPGNRGRERRKAEAGAVSESPRQPRPENRRDLAGAPASPLGDSEGSQTLRPG